MKKKLLAAMLAAMCFGAAVPQGSCKPKATAASQTSEAAKKGTLTVTVYNEDEGGLYTDERTSFMICGGPDQTASAGMGGAVFLCDVTPSESNPFVLNDIDIVDNFKYTIVDSGSPDYDGFNYRIDYERSDRTFKFTENPNQDLSIYMKKNYFVVNSDKSVTVATHGQEIFDNVGEVCNNILKLINSDDFKALATADRISKAKELMKSLSDEELIADYSFDAENNVMKFTYKYGTITGQLRPAVFEDEHKQLNDTTLETPEEISYKIIRLPDKLEYKVGESISLKGIQIEVKKGDEEPVVCTYSEVAFAHESNTPGVPKVLLYTDFHGDKAGTYKVGLIDDENISFDVRVVDNDVYTTAVTTTTPKTTGTAAVEDDPGLQTAVATVRIMDVSGDTILVKPVDGSPELRSSDKFTLSAKQLPADLNPKAGMKLEITYNGGILETYPAMFGNVQKVVAVSDDTEKEDPTALKGTKEMTLDDVKELAKKGSELDWSDFGDYKGRDVGSGQNVWRFEFGDGYVLEVCGVADRSKPDCVILSCDGDYVDLLKDSINGFLIMTSDYTMIATVTEIINGKSLLVKDTGGRGDVLTLPVDKLDSSVTPTVGMKLEIIYRGGILETYPAMFANIQKVTVLSDTDVDTVTVTVTVMEINGDTLLVKPADDSIVMNVGDRFTVPVNKLDSGVTPAAGMMLEITFDGRILSTYPARFSNIEKIRVLSETAEIAAGDANCDGQVDMSDVVLIMQAFANPDKYGEKGSAMIHLTGLGRLNADMDGDGLTVGDAQSIQKKLLGIGDDPATPVTAQPIGFKDIDAAIDAINKSDVKAYPKAYRNDYLKMFLRIKNDGSIYQLTENETIKAKNDSEVALFPYARYEDIGVGYYVTFKEKNYHIMFYYADADVLAETDGIAEYLKKRMGRGSDKTVRIQDKDVSLLFHENGQCYANAFIDDNHYFDVIGAVSEDELTEFLNAFEYEKLSIISKNHFGLDSDSAEKLGLKDSKIKSVNVTSLPNGYDFTFTGDKAQKFIDFLSDLELTSDFSEDPGQLGGMTWVIKLEYENDEAMTLYDIGGFIRSESNSWFKYEYDYNSPLDNLIWELSK